MNIFLLLAIAMALIIILLRRHVPIGPCMLVGGLFIWAMKTPNLHYLWQGFAETLTMSRTYDILFALYFVMCLEIELRTSGSLAGMVHALQRIFSSTKVTLAVMPAFLRSFTSDEETIRLGLQYANIVFGFAMIIALDLAFEKLFQAVGQMTVAMVSMLSGCIANILLDPILIFGLGPAPALGIQGAAIATGLGQVITLIAYLLFYCLRPVPVRLRFKDLHWDWHLTGKLYSIGIPATLNLALPSVLISALNAILAAYSQVYVLVLGIYYKLQTFLYLTANGLIQGIRPLIGYNYGAREYQRVRKIYSTTLLITLAIMCLGTGLCLVFPDKLISLFTDTEETIQIGTAALRIISAGFIVSSVSIVSSGALEGLGMGMPSLIISLCRYLLIIVPAAFWLSRLMGASGVWHAFWITELLCAIISWFTYRKMTRHR